MEVRNALVWRQLERVLGCWFEISTSTAHTEFNTNGGIFNQKMAGAGDRYDVFLKPSDFNYRVRNVSHFSGLILLGRFVTT